MQQSTKDLLSFLRQNPQVRTRIAAPPNQTLLYAGNFFRPVWQEIEQLKLRSPEAASKKLLPEVLATIATPGQPYPNLLVWAKALDNLQPWRENGFIAWRALSGIYASNAVGAVSLQVGSGIDKANKVLAATEIPVLLRNANIDPLTRDIVEYYQRCIRLGQPTVNLGLMRDA